MTHMMTSKRWSSLGSESSLILEMSPGRLALVQRSPIELNDCLMTSMASSDSWLVVPFCCSRSAMNAARNLFLSAGSKRQDHRSTIRIRQEGGATSRRRLTGREVVRVLGEDGVVELAEQGKDVLRLDEQVLNQRVDYSSGENARSACQFQHGRKK